MITPPPKFYFAKQVSLRRGAVTVGLSGLRGMDKDAEDQRRNLAGSQEAEPKISQS